MSTPERFPKDPSAALSRPGGATIAYHRTAGKTPGLLFLGGFMSDMTGDKAMALESCARTSGHAFIRFDYQGHGASSGKFEDGTIGLWAEDALAVLDELTEGPQVLVGSSMGGWIMLLAALARPERVAGLVGIAAAPDFTEDLIWARYGQELRETLVREGVYHEPSDYGDEPYSITLRLIQDGREHLLLRDRIPLTCPIRLIHGTADSDVPWQTSVRIAEQVDSDDVEIILVKDGGHRLSGERDLSRLAAVVERLCAQVG